MLTTFCQWEVGIDQKTVVEFIDGDAMDGMDETDSPTPPKTNMEPENGPLEKEIPIGNHHFQVPC